MFTRVHIFYFVYCTGLPEKAVASEKNGTGIFECMI